MGSLLSGTTLQAAFHHDKPQLRVCLKFQPKIISKFLINQEIHLPSFLSKLPVNPEVLTFLGCQEGFGLLLVQGKTLHTSYLFCWESKRWSSFQLGFSKWIPACPLLWYEVSNTRAAMAYAASVTFLEMPPSLTNVRQHPAVAFIHL